MSNKRITDLTELITPTTDDVFPVVDIATNTTTKVQLGNLPVTTAVTTALATKQDTLVSGTNIKTVNSTSLVGSGNVAVQPTLVSGTNIKTLNSVSLLGSGDIVLAATPSGVAGAIQFSNGSAFASDAANLFWDDTNNRLGVGTNTPTNTFEVASTSASPFKVATTQSYFRATFQNSSGSGILDFNSSNFQFPTNNVDFGTSTALGARVGIKGSGSTSATTSLLVQDSAGTERFRIYDNGTISFGGGTLSSIGTAFATTTAVTNINTNNNAFTALTTNGTTGNVNILQSLGVGAASPNASARLQVDSTTKGFLPPRMTTAEKNAIATPAAGLVVYDSTTNKLCCYNGSTWNDLF